MSFEVIGFFITIILNKPLFNLLGMTVEEYRAALQSHSSQLEPKQYPVTVDPSPHPLPPTSAGTYSFH